LADGNYSLNSLQSYLLQYQTLLHDFKKSWVFLKENPNPAMSAFDCGAIEAIMMRECNNLLSGIDKLERKCLMFIERLKNATALSFAAVNVEDSSQTHQSTNATLPDSAAMKQLRW
jgi:hypothetical protein